MLIVCSIVIQLFLFYRINEYAKQFQQTQGENSKAAQNRALLFDISFLMLCHITQLYGSEVMLILWYTVMSYHPALWFWGNVNSMI